MKSKFKLIALFYLTFFSTFLLPPLQARDAHEEWLNKLSPHDLYNLMTDKFREEKWLDAITFGKILVERYPSSPFYKEAFYYNGLAYYRLNDYQLANDCFTAYLKEEKSPKYFDQIIQYKFDIANAFEEGNRRHMFGYEKMPRWMLAFEDAVVIYDEIIASLPRDELAAKSLFRKGNLLLKLEQYKDSVESFQTLIRRFPKHPLTPEAYLMINRVYFNQCLKEFPDPDRLDLAEINLRKFQLHFPNDSRIEEGREMILEIKEHLAKDLYEIGKFYEKTKKKDSALIYYKSIVKKYPESRSAKEAAGRLAKLAPLAEPKKEEQKVEEQITVENEKESPLPPS